MVRPVLLCYCLGSFHKLQILQIIGHVTRTLAWEGYKNVKIPKHLEIGALIIGAHPGAMKHSELDVDGDKMIHGVLYDKEKFHEDPMMQNFAC